MLLRCAEPVSSVEDHLLVAIGAKRLAIGPLRRYAAMKLIWTQSRAIGTSRLLKHLSRNLVVQIGQYTSTLGSQVDTSLGVPLVRPESQELRRLKLGYPSSDLLR